METEEKIQYIKDVITNSKSGSSFLEIESKNAVDNIYHLFTTKEALKITEDVEHVYYGWYYTYIEPNPINMMYYYMSKPNNMHCMINLWHYYKSKKKYRKFIKYANVAGGLGHYKSYTEIAKYYESIEDYENMATYFEKAIDLGDISAMLSYAYYFLDKEDYSSAEKYLKLAGDNKYAKTELAAIYQKREDYKSMKEQLNGIEDYSIASYMLGAHYFHKERNYKLAINHLTKAMELKSALAMKTLAYYYRYIAKDIEKAIECLTRAINLGDAEAMMELAHLYQYVLFDKENAVKYYEMSIRGNNIKAALLLGEYYETEEQDYDKMKLYYNMAINENVSDKDKHIQIKCIENLLNYYNVHEKDEKCVQILIDKLKKVTCTAYPSLADKMTDSLFNTFYTSILKNRYK